LKKVDWFPVFLICITTLISITLIHCGDDDDDDGDSFLQEYCAAYVEKASDCESHWDADTHGNLPQVSDWVPNCVSQMRWWNSDHIACLNGCLGEPVCADWKECANDCSGNWDFTISDEATWVDTDSGLQWQTQFTGTADFQTANTNCEALELDGHDNWRLPTIDELRTLVRGCSLTEPGGACDVTENCISLSTCRNLPCYGYLSGEGPSARGHYLPDVFPIRCEQDRTALCLDLWSSTGTDDANYYPYDLYSWVIDFRHARVTVEYRSGKIGYHCVREAG
jgi:Protein of unknown function (DUF1566)